MECKCNTISRDIKLSRVFRLPCIVSHQKHGKTSCSAWDFQRIRTTTGDRLPPRYRGDRDGPSDVMFKSPVVARPKCLAVFAVAQPARVTDWQMLGSSIAVVRISCSLFMRPARLQMCFQFSRFTFNFSAI